MRRLAGMVVVVQLVLVVLGVLEVRVHPTYLDHLVDLGVLMVREDLVDHLFLLDRLVHLLDLVGLKVRMDLDYQEDLLDHLVPLDLEDPLDRQDLEVQVVVVEELVVVEVVVEVVVVLGDNRCVNMLEHMCLSIHRHMGWLLVCILKTIEK